MANNSSCSGGCGLVIFVIFIFLMMSSCVSSCSGSSHSSSRSSHGIDFSKEARELGVSPREYEEAFNYFYRGY